MTERDNINPRHYKFTINIPGIGEIEVESIDEIRGFVTKEEFRGFAKVSAIAYLIRSNKKHETPLEDFEKARRMLDFLINNEKDEPISGEAKETIAVHDKLNDLLSKQEKEFIQDKKIVKVFMNGEEINIPESEAKDIINFLGDIVYGED